MLAYFKCFSSPRLDVQHVRPFCVSQNNLDFRPFKASEINIWKMFAFE